MNSRYSKPIPVWFYYVPVLLVSVHFLQWAVIMPVEARFLPELTKFASIVYLPHAVRILATAIVGPRVFFALLPAFLLVHYFELPPDNGLISAEMLWAGIVSAGCGPVGYYILKFFYGVGPTFSVNLRNWKPVFLIGILASLINSIGLAIVYREYFDIGTFPSLLMKYFVGDIVGLAIGLLVLVLFFRLIRGGSSPN